jgi:CRISPR/Cas system endoribonuclease Cas6 (RAMP superfamily)
MEQTFFSFPKVAPGTCIFTFTKNVENALYSRTQGTYTGWRYVAGQLSATIHHLPGDSTKIQHLLAQKFGAIPGE